MKLKYSDNQLIDMLDAASRDETQADGNLYRIAARRIGECMKRDANHWHRIMQRTDLQAYKIRKLEDEISIFKNLDPGISDSVWAGLIEKVIALEAKLHAVHKLKKYDHGKQVMNAMDAGERVVFEKDIIEALKEEAPEMEASG